MWIYTKYLQNRRLRAAGPDTWSTQATTGWFSRVSNCPKIYQKYTKNISKYIQIYTRYTRDIQIYTRYTRYIQNTRRWRPGPAPDSAAERAGLIFLYFRVLENDTWNNWEIFSEFVPFDNSCYNLLCIFCLFLRPISFFFTRKCDLTYIEMC